MECFFLRLGHKTQLKNKLQLQDRDIVWKTIDDKFFAVRQIDVYMSATHFDLSEQIQPFGTVAERR